MKQTKHVALRAELLALAARPGGFGRSEVRSADHNMVTRVVDSMVNKHPQRLFKAVVNRNHVRYFDTPERAAEYRNEHVIAIRPLAGESVVRKRSVHAPAGPVTTPDHVRVQVCPGIERVYEKRDSFIGAFGSTKLGQYPFPATWSDNVLGGAA